MSYNRINTTDRVARQESARMANNEIKEYWKRKPSEEEIYKVIKEKLVGLNPLSKPYFTNLFYYGDYIGLSKEELKRGFLSEPEILEELDRDSAIDPDSLFEEIDQICLDSGVVTNGYISNWKINLDTGESYDENAEREEGRRFALPIYYQTFEELFKPE